MQRPTLRFMLGHPARWIALGFGSGLAPKAPGTFGTLWAWGIYALAEVLCGPQPWGWIVALGTLLGVWACTRCAQHMGVADPGAIVWDEVLAFWLVLWLAGTPVLWQQALLFGAFRYFDAAKPGPVRWADGLFKAERGGPIGWRQGLGILLDDFVAAGCTLGVWALALLALQRWS
ncbi:phosphatidylglycerophosphatase A [Inhella inkyongensis]|uniref:Phosphatidylglycerophosphatase A n=1 Tax=Inhella inkyongensis TaxID=392593 RepID=A0A840RZQ4_9BURK|nr:phosphatidylglycerophosphatase A [Inhella inkyongensis]MBB5203033.1 phosphatidylglycerophosphatase A [Inhella inkyongensis]